MSVQYMKEYSKIMIVGCFNSTRMSMKLVTFDENSSDIHSIY